MRGRLRISPEGVELRNVFRRRRFAWSEILIFKTREYTARYAPRLPVFFALRPTVWMRTRRGDWHQVLGLTAEEQVHQLNLAMDEGWTNGEVDMSRFAGPGWARMWARAEREVRSRRH